MKKYIIALIAVLSVALCVAFGVGCGGCKNKNSRSKCDHDWVVIYSGASCHRTETMYCTKCLTVSTYVDYDASFEEHYCLPEDENIKYLYELPGHTLGNNIENAVCYYCNQRISPDDKLVNHDYKNAVIPEIPATCYSEGKTAIEYCEICGFIRSGGEVIPKAEHDTEITKPAVPPTCTEEGKTEEIACKTCGYVQKSQQAVPPTGHKDLDQDLKCDVCEAEIEVQFTEIHNAAQLQAINDNLSGSYIIAENISLSGVEWTPIGLNGRSFCGRLYSREGVTISGLNYSSNAGFGSGYIGLFARNCGVIDGVTLTDSALTLTNGAGAVGGLVGLNNGVIRNCKVENLTVSHSYSESLTTSNASDTVNRNVQISIGSITGENNGTVSGCESANLQITAEYITTFNWTGFLTGFDTGLKVYVSLNAGSDVGLNNGTVSGCVSTAAGTLNVSARGNESGGVQDRVASNVSAHIGKNVGEGNAAVDSDGQLWNATRTEGSNGQIGLNGDYVKN